MKKVKCSFILIENNNNNNIFFINFYSYRCFKKYFLNARNDLFTDLFGYAIKYVTQTCILNEIGIEYL